MHAPSPIRNLTPSCLPRKKHPWQRLWPLSRSSPLGPVGMLEIGPSATAQHRWGSRNRLFRNRVASLGRSNRPLEHAQPHGRSKLTAKSCFASVGWAIQISWSRPLWLPRPRAHVGPMPMLAQGLYPNPPSTTQCPVLKLFGRCWTHI